MTRAKPPLVFAHGWGFNAGVWAHVVPHFGAFDVSYVGVPYVRGGPTLHTKIPDNAVLVGHSFGLAQTLYNLPATTRAVVSICGFDNLPARGRGRAIDDIRAGLARNPSAQMRAFWANCGVKQFANADQIDVVALEKGLEAMLKINATPKLRALTCPVLALVSRNDRIVPPELSRAVWENYEMVTSEDGEHGLPVTRPTWCANQIKSFLEAHVA